MKTTEYHGKCVPKLRYRPLSVVERDLERKRNIEIEIDKHKHYLMQFVAPSNRNMFNFIFENWIIVPPWVGPTIQELDRRKERSKRAYYRLMAKNQKITRSTTMEEEVIIPSKNREIKLHNSEISEMQGQGTTAQSPGTSWSFG